MSNNPPCSPSLNPPWPMLLLDSGASSHMVGDPRLLSDLHDMPAGSMVTVLDGTTLPITKIGNIHMPTEGFTISGVLLVPGLKLDVISVRQLTIQRRICTSFDADRAMLYSGSELVGEAVAQENFAGGLYVLKFLKMQPRRFAWSKFLRLRVYTPKQQLRLHILMQNQKQLRLRIQKQKGVVPMHCGDHSSSSSPPSGPPKLVLDSGASFHMVPDTRLLCNLRDAPAGLRVVAANGNKMLVTKIGDIHIQGLTIRGVGVVPGLEDDGLISVRQLARESRFCSWFVGDQAVIYAEGNAVVGVAVASREDRLNGLYVLRTPKIAAA